jgi:hypothetical protein
MNRPTYCRTTGQRIGDCVCLRCTPPKEQTPCNKQPSES